MEQGRYTVLLAIRTDPEEPIGFATLCESHALYAEGSFGILQEFYIRPELRSRSVGALLLKGAMDQAMLRGWNRLELCTPPLPEFGATLRFYEKNGFEVTGGRKMKIVLQAA